jgi:peptidyl-prolyl cis-trans isomerase B (cyclophilin B)
MMRTLLTHLAAVALAGATLIACDSPNSGGTVAPVDQLENPKESAEGSSASVSLGTPKADPVETEAQQGGQKAGQTSAPGATEPAKGEEVAVLETSKGRVILKFFPKEAPATVENFKKLTKKGFYDGTKFHRAVPGFMIQGGDPNTKTGQGQPGTGDPGYKIKAEFNPIKHKRGILSMARSNDPDSAGSQFFIMVDEAPFLDGSYTAFGQVVSGMDAVDKIVNLPTSGEMIQDMDQATIKSAKIEKWPVK